MVKGAKKEVKEARSGKRKAALALALIAAVILLVQAVYLLSSKQELLQKFAPELEELVRAGITMELFSRILFWFAIAWFVLLALLVLLVVRLEQRKVAWWSLLLLGIAILLSLRLDSGVLCIVAALLYKK